MLLQNKDILMPITQPAMASINNAESGDPRNSLLSPGDKVVTRTRLGRQESKTPPSRQLVTINDGDDNYDQDDEDHILPQMSTESTPLLMSPPHPSPSLRDKKRSSASYSKSWAASFSHTVRNNMSNALSASIRRLQKSLGFAQGFFLTVGVLIGSGIFLSPSLVAKSTQNMGMALMIWIGCGFIALLGALSYCELGCAIKKAGGNYAYIYEAYGPLPAFLCSWTTVFIIDPACICTVSLTFGTYAVKPFFAHNGDAEMAWLAKVLAAVCILLVAVVNCWSIKVAGRVQTLFTFAQISSVLFVVVLGIWQMALGKVDNIRTMFDTDNNNSTMSFNSIHLGQIAMALYNGLWSYDGWALIANVTEEMRNLERNLFLSVITGIPFVIVCYVLVNLSLMTVLTRTEIANNPTVVITFVQKVLGKKVAYIMPVLVALSCYGAANGTVFACGRLTLAAAREGHMPEVFGMIHKKRFTPIPAILLTCVIAGLMLVPDGSNLESLIGYFNFACWTIYGVSIFAVIVLRVRQPHLDRPFRIWLVVPLLMTLISLFLVSVPFLEKPVECGITIAVILFGVPIYFLLVYKEQYFCCHCFKKCVKGFNRVIRKAFNLAPCKF